MAYSLPIRNRGLTIIPEPQQPADLKFTRHRCLRCFRPITATESIVRRLGPVCYKKVVTEEECRQMEFSVECRLEKAGATKRFNSGSTESLKEDE